MIKIHPSPTADTRTCDFANVTKEQLYTSSIQHIGDVNKGFLFFMDLMAAASKRHDHDKLTDIEVSIVTLSVVSNRPLGGIIIVRSTGTTC